MTDFATLALRIDASEVDPAAMKLDKLAASGGKAEASQKGLGISVEQAERHMRKASIVLGDLKAKEDAVAQSARGAGAAASDMARKAQDAAVGLGKAGAVSGQTKAGMQQLSYQIGDVATQFALGAKPMQIFAAQGSQVIQAIGQMSGGATGLLGILGGPWGIAISAAVTVLGTLGASFLSRTDEANAFTEALREQITVADQAADAYRELSGQMKIGTIGQIGLLQSQMTQLSEQRAKVQSDLARFSSGLSNNGDYSPKVRELRAEYMKLGQQMLNVTNAINMGNKSLREQDEAARKVAATTGRATAATARATGASTAHAKAIKAETDELGEFQKALAERFEKDTQATAALDRRVQAIRNETAVMGLVGEARERATLALEEEGFKAQAAAEGIIDVEAAWQKYLAARVEGIDKQSVLDRDADAAKRATEALDAYNDSLLDIIGSLGRIGGFGGVLGGVLGVLTGNTGAIGGPIGDLLNIGIDLDPLTGEMRKLGDVLGGAIGNLGQSLTGALANAGIGVMAGSAAFGNQGVKGQIASGIGGILGGMGGSALAGVLSGGVASSLGGAAASAAIGSTLGAALGSALPVIGTILGGLAGAALTKLLSGATRGSAIISGGDVSGFYGNSAKNKEQAGGLAGSVLSAIEQLSQQLGGTYDPSKGKVSIGVRDGKYYIDEQGRGYTKSSIAGVKGFGTDQEAAVKAAIMDLINDGVISGLREGTMKLLQAGGDIEEQMAKALAFESVFKDIEKAANPFKDALEAMKVQFDQLKIVFKEAGASAEEFAQLQQYMVDQQQALIDQMSANYRSTFYSDSENAAFAKTQIASTLGPLGYGSVDTVAEYRALVEATDALANPELYGALMGLVDAFGVLKSAEEAAADAARAAAAQREAERAAARAERERQIEEAKNALRSAYQREAGELQQTIDRFGAFADTLADFRRELLAGENGAASYAMRLAELRRVGALASVGDENALGALPGAGRDFLTAAKARAGTGLEYQRAVAMVARYAASAEQASLGMATEAQKQLDKLDATVGKLIDIDEGVISVEQAIRDLIRLQGGGTSTGTGSTRPSWLPSFGLPSFGGGGGRGIGGAWGGSRFFDDPVRVPMQSNDNQTTQAVEQLDRRQANTELLLERMAGTLDRQERLWRNMSPDGLSWRITTDGVPIETEAA